MQLLHLKLLNIIKYWLIFRSTMAVLLLSKMFFLLLTCCLPFRRSSRTSRGFTSNSEGQRVSQRQRLVEVLGYGRSRSPPPDPDSPPGETAAAERPDSPSTRPIMAHLLEMGFTAPHIRKALEALGMKPLSVIFVYA